MAPLTNYSSYPDGTVSDEELKYYERRANGVGMVITACAYVTPNGKGFPGEFACDSDEMIPSLRQLATAIKKRGAKAILQIFHGGRLCLPELVPNGELVSASAVAPEFATEFDGQPPLPRALQDYEIEDIIRAFGDATRRAIEAGYDGVEIHGANGYLVQQFFSPHSNRRNDCWGGDLVKRMAFLLAIVDEIKKVVDEHANHPFLVGYRFSPEEPETPGITMTDTFALINALIEKELDYLHVSLSDFWSLPRRGVEDTHTRIEWILKTVANRIPVIGVGLIKTADDALNALQTGISLIALGRVIIMDPDWVEKVETGQESAIETRLKMSEQHRLVIPNGLWNQIMNRPGWFPVDEHLELKKNIK
jgi:2,4-dienoyl-CoA reductase-like NADH-dependent reductase (Old Yellow Enzyme family)